MSSRKQDDSLTEEDVHAISRALADPSRFEIVRKIAARPVLACAALREQVAITAATLSHHLKELELCGLIETSRNGKFMDIRFRRQRWRAYLEALKTIDRSR